MSPGKLPMIGTAVLSEDGRYRYRLARIWDTDPHGMHAVFVMLNPSTANADIDDPTIRRCIGFARDRWGCAGLLVVNLLAWRATDPDDLPAGDEAIGPDNDRHIVEAAEFAARTGGPLVAAWGSRGRLDRIAAVVTLPGMQNLTALALTKAGQPRHPLYLAGNLTPQPWRAP